jgi:hypothetical protein
VVDGTGGADHEVAPAGAFVVYPNTFHGCPCG